jgi:hypothetical protein
MSGIAVSPQWFLQNYVERGEEVFNEEFEIIPPLTEEIIEEFKQELIQGVFGDEESDMESCPGSPESQDTIDLRPIPLGFDMNASWEENEHLFH